MPLCLSWSIPSTLRAGAFGVAVLMSTQAPAQTREVVAPSPQISQTCSALMAAPVVQKLFADLQSDDARTLAELRRIVEIEAPPFHEQVRAQYMLGRFKALGLADAAIDGVGNVVAVRKGSGKGPTLLVSAHLDTVFPAGTDVKVKERGDKLYAPGISDDVRGLAVLLAYIKALNENHVQTTGDIVFAANVGEEGLGDLRGMKRIFQDRPGISGMVGIEPGPMNLITTIGTASHRYEVHFIGPGGHSFEAFGLPSATQAMGRAIAKISNLQVPSEPRTTFTVGTVSGGTSVNTIAGDARMAVDMRSNGMESLLDLEKRLLATLPEAVAEENTRWGATQPDGSIRVETKLIGDRPGGETLPSSTIVETAVATAAAFGQGTPTLSGSSTDANVPMSLGIPAIIVSSGGSSGGWHSRDEWYQPAGAWKGAQQTLLTVLALVGLPEATPPLLATK